ncbi:uncharacterized protein EV420DRAFT_589100 [Desarmillaria tabescens]|uniref:Uncharacterized protein n=1 Tax=Armillaria tabescens TaxID=1929756 RepID=A0AA39N277_ARMTA|nr:uncharacterized protein EV420DRAFT_589100 [Desarmillaria tabescens]KAK0455222.1 hypothetical protein EV420DRAFT_589100 [Desarmillaria tabescens]
MPNNRFSFSLPTGLKVTLTAAIYGKLSSKSRSPADAVLQSRSDQAPTRNGKRVDNTTTISVHVVEETEQEVPQPTYSPEEDPEENTAKLTSLGIKVRDFAPSSASSSSSTPPVVELFNHHIAIAEYELRMRETPRVSPISGKMLYRLVNMGCITREEARKRWHRMDWDSLRSYEAMGKPYPYRTIQSLSVPTTRKERERIMEEWGHYVVFYDHVRAKSCKAESKAVKAREARQMAYLEVEKANREAFGVDLAVCPSVGVSRERCIGPSLRRKRPTMDGNNKPEVVIHCDSAASQPASIPNQQCSLSLQRIEGRQ